MTKGTQLIFLFLFSSGCFSELFTGVKPETSGSWVGGGGIRRVFLFSSICDMIFLLFFFFALSRRQIFARENMRSLTKKKKKKKNTVIVISTESVLVQRYLSGFYVFFQDVGLTKLLFLSFFKKKFFQKICCQYLVILILILAKCSQVYIRPSKKFCVFFICHSLTLFQNHHLHYTQHRSPPTIPTQPLLPPRNQHTPYILFFVFQHIVQSSRASLPYSVLCIPFLLYEKGAHPILKTVRGSVREVVQWGVAVAKTRGTCKRQRRN